MFKPRLTDAGVSTSKYWNSNINPLWQAGYRLPNCTTYAWGRFYEETPKYIPELPVSNAGMWYQQAIDKGFYQVGQVPKLGSVICFEDTSGGAGHVAIVEVIKKNGDIITSNSAFGGSYFYTQELKKSNNYNDRYFKTQGFIYNPHIEDIEPPTPTRKNKHKFKWVLYARKLRDIRN